MLQSLFREGNVGPLNFIFSLKWLENVKLGGTLSELYHEYRQKLPENPLRRQKHVLYSCNKMPSVPLNKDF